MDQLITLWIDSDTKTKARVAAAKQSISMSEWIRRAIDERLRLFFDNGAENITRDADNVSEGTAQALRSDQL